MRAGNAIVGGDTEMKERGREIDSGCGASVEAELRSEPDLTSQFPLSFDPFLSSSLIRTASTKSRMQ